MKRADRESNLVIPPLNPLMQSAAVGVGPNTPDVNGQETVDIKLLSPEELTERPPVASFDRSAASASPPTEFHPMHGDLSRAGTGAE